MSVTALLIIKPNNEIVKLTLLNDNLINIIISSQLLFRQTGRCCQESCSDHSRAIKRFNKITMVSKRMQIKHYGYKCLQFVYKYWILILQNI